MWISLLQLEEHLSSLKHWSYGGILSLFCNVGDLKKLFCMWNGCMWGKKTLIFTKNPQLTLICLMQYGILGKQTLMYLLSYM